MTTTTTAADTYPHYAAAYAAQSPDGPPSLREWRRRGWESFLSLGLPIARRGNEPWKYTNAGVIARQSFAFADNLPVASAGVATADARAVAPWQPDWRTLTFIDGVFAPHLSDGLCTPQAGSPQAGNPDALIVAPLSDAVGISAELGEQFLGALAPADEDGFAALNTAFVRSGAGLSVPAGADAGIVHLLHLATDRNLPRAACPRTLIKAGPNSRLTVIETFCGPDSAQYLTNAVTEIFVGAGASVEHYRLLFEGSEAYHVGISRVVQGKDSRFSSVSIAHGAALGRNDFGVHLAGTGAECTLNGLYLTQGNQHIDNYINIDHAEPYGTSRLFYKGILDGSSRAVFGGNVTVRKDAQKTDAQQTDKNLLLSAEAEVDSKPSLLIYADDVKCGHGATAGHIDADTVFYMRSRGIDLPTASRILIHAFASEIIDTVALEPLREYLDARFQNAIPDADISLPVGGRS